MNFDLPVKMPDGTTVIKPWCFGASLSFGVDPKPLASVEPVDQGAASNINITNHLRKG